MNRILKTFALFLLVSTVSFVYAQNELDDDVNKGSGKSVVKDNAGSGVKLDGVKKDGGAKKPAAAKMESHEKGKSGVTKDMKSTKGSFWKSLFGGKKAKKEDDPN